MSERKNENFRIDVVNQTEFSVIDIIFDDGMDGVDLFYLVVDDDWFLCSDGKLRQDKEMGELFGFIEVNPKTGRKYVDILDRALEATGWAMRGKFKKEVEK